jgi:hypothetical protein
MRRLASSMAIALLVVLSIWAVFRFPDRLPTWLSNVTDSPDEANPATPEQTPTQAQPLGPANVDSPEPTPTPSPTPSPEDDEEDEPSPTPTPDEDETEPINGAW